jgi:Tol biopolymer transport system component
MTVAGSVVVWLHEGGALRAVERFMIHRMGPVLAVLALPLLAQAADAGEVRFTAEGHAYNPIFSKDGKWLAYEVNGYGEGGIDMFVSSVTGAIAKDGVQVKLAGASPLGGAAQVLINPTWHPGGLAIFEGSNQGGDYRMYIYTPGGGSPSELLSTTKAPGQLTFPSVSPDGNTIAFVSSATGNGDIKTWDRVKDTMGQLTTTEHTESFPIYSADSKTLLFNRNSGGTEDIFALDLATKTEKALITGGGDQSRAIYAAGGKILYFTNERGTDAWDIAVVDSAGAGKVVLAKDVRLPLRSRPALSPDGNWVAWTSNKAELGGKVYVTKIDGTKTAEISTEFNACGEPALTVNSGRTVLAFTYLQNSGADWRHLAVEDITDKLQ